MDCVAAGSRDAILNDPGRPARRRIIGAAEVRLANVTVWAVRSKSNPDLVGWWAISGDLPTDYMTREGEQDAGDILLGFATRWREAATRMAAGEQPDGFRIGDLKRARELAPLLSIRADLLYDFGIEEKSRDTEGEL